MTEISDTERVGSNDSQMGGTSDHEDFDDSNTFDSDQGEGEEEEEEEDDYGAFQDFDGSSDNQDNQDNDQNFSPSPSREENVAGLTMNTSDFELAEDGTPLVFFDKFQTFPEEIQMSIWHFSALQARRTIVMYLQQNIFKFENCPSTPAFMHACHQARKYGQEYFCAVDDKGVLHDFTDPKQVNTPYFYVNPISDDFILKFGQYMQQELAAEEKKLHKIEEDEEWIRSRRLGRVRRRLHAPAHVANAHTATWNMITQNMHHIPASNTGILAATVATNAATAAASAPPSPPRPGEPVFPPASVLPHFFDNIRSVGINLSLNYSGYTPFEELNAMELQKWAEENVQHKFDKVFKKILDRFPHLEYIFAVVRAYGRSNRCMSDRGSPRELEKKDWKSVGMAKGSKQCMGYQEFKQFENQAKVWLMHERIERGLQLNSLDFGLYVQTNILWEI
ncbi:hypothetical protein BPOR_0122g00190 [Botrytis porri]|uniref:2EXR domain-containing protein n=1 Tax=Botrytis porri TaxID=87229 RepID=A0A4Z1KXF0_9HELO|nr:hypothetical protein BPOR_0122g00190 [Botrytis porri]